MGARNPKQVYLITQIFGDLSAYLSPLIKGQAAKMSKEQKNGAMGAYYYWTESELWFE